MGGSSGCSLCLAGVHGPNTAAVIPDVPWASGLSGRNRGGVSSLSGRREPSESGPSGQALCPGFSSGFGAAEHGAAWRSGCTRRALCVCGTERFVGGVPWGSRPLGASGYFYLCPDMDICSRMATRPLTGVQEGGTGPGVPSGSRAWLCTRALAPRAGEGGNEVAVWLPQGQCAGPPRACLCAGGQMPSPGRTCPPLQALSETFHQIIYTTMVTARELWSEAVCLSVCLLPRRLCAALTSALRTERSWVPGACGGGARAG